MSDVAAVMPVPFRRGSRRKVRNPLALLTVQSIDGRTRAGHRVRQIAAELARGRTGLTALQLQAIERAALACVIAEDLAARQLAGFPVSIDELVRAEGSARRAVAAVKAEHSAQAQRGGLRGLKPLSMFRGKR